MTARIPILTLDDFLSSNDIRKVDSVRMDIGGAELSALKGAREVVANHSPSLAISSVVFDICSAVTDNSSVAETKLVTIF